MLEDEDREPPTAGTELTTDVSLRDDLTAALIGIPLRPLENSPDFGGSDDDLI